MKRIFQFYLWIAVLVLPAAAAPMNIVLFVADDLSPTLGCYGDKAARTPNADRLAAEGTLFRNAFCTTASCSASRSVILTGLHNHANGQYGHQHSYHKFGSYPSVQSLPVMLQRLGYRTARIGKHHTAPEEVYFFETKLPGNGRSPVEMAEQSESFIKAGGKPFFLFFATTDPHRGGGLAADLPDKPDLFGNKPRRGSHTNIKEVFYGPKDVPVPAFLPDTAAARAELAQYYQSVARVDQGLGRLIEILKAAGRLDDTLIAFTSDHGMAFPGAKTTVYEPGLRVPFIVRDPRLARRGIASDAMISLVDLTPTLLDAGGGWDVGTQSVKPAALPLTAGSPKKGKGNVGTWLTTKLHGRSFLPILGEKSASGWDAIYASHTFHEIQMYYPMRVVRDRKFKLIWNIAHPLPFPFASDLWEAPTWQAQFKQGPKAPYGQKTVEAYIHRPAFELFDIAADPNETHNLAADPKHAETLQLYKAKLKDFQVATQDPWILKWDYE